MVFRGDRMELLRSLLAAKGLTAEEYLQFLEMDGNKEEKHAARVVDYIVSTFGNAPDASVVFYPHFGLNSKQDGKFEFDLIALIARIKGQETHYTIVGVEFKRSLTPHLVQQAVVRVPFVDYMLICTQAGTRDSFLDPARDPQMFISDLLVLSYFGIGWLLCKNEELVVVLPPVKQTSQRIRWDISAPRKKVVEHLEELIDQAFSKTIERALERAFSELFAGTMVNVNIYVPKLRTTLSTTTSTLEE